jgi:hypothetical protein
VGVDIIIQVFGYNQPHDVRLREVAYRGPSELTRGRGRARAREVAAGRAVCRAGAGYPCA